MKIHLQRWCGQDFRPEKSTAMAIDGDRSGAGAAGGGYERVIDSPYGTPRENWGDDSKDRREGMTDQQAFSNAP